MAVLASGPAEVNLNPIYTGMGWTFSVGPIIRTDTSAAIGLSAAQMDIRQGRSFSSVRVARMDTGGASNGLIAITGGSLNNMTITLPEGWTETMTTGMMYYDLWVKPSSSDWMALYYGTVQVLPHVTDVFY